MKFTFTPNIKTLTNVDAVRTTDEIKNEPMIFSGDARFAHTNGGPLTREITNRLLKHDDFRNVQMFAADEQFKIVIDTRVTMTMPGMYPSIPGWHCDDVPRGKTHGQPVLHGINPFCQHFMVILSDQEDAVSCTEFVTRPLELDIDMANVWGSVDKQVNNILENQNAYNAGRPEEEQIKPLTKFLTQGEIIRFNQEAIHRASLTKTAGWRFFYRASITHRKPANEIRKQVQVYASTHGW
jgi:hypothetical protein